MKHKLEYIPEDLNIKISYGYFCSCGWEYKIPYPNWIAHKDSFHRMKLIEHVLEAENLCEFQKIQEDN